ncbi:hypothetical protein D3C72_267680 [compost metagenome]
MQFEFQHWDSPHVISHHKTGGGFWFQGLAKSYVEVPTGDVAAHSVLGNLKASCCPETQEIYEWCNETFGEEWKRWHLKLIVNLAKDRWSRQNAAAHKISVEAFFVDLADFAIFKLRWHE